MRYIILPGWEQGKAEWAEVVRQLGEEFSLLTLELPGFGEEPLVSEEWGVEEYAGWVRTRVDGLVKKDEKVVLVGHSFGGRVAVALAARENPPWLAGLVLYGAPILARPSFSVRLKRVVAAIGKRLLPSSLRAILLKHFLSDDALRARGTGKEQIFRRAVLHDQTEEFCSLSLPVVLLWGERDSEVPLAIAEEMVFLQPGVTMEVLPMLGHNVHLENPVFFCGTLRRVFSGFL